MESEGARPRGALALILVLALALPPIGFGPAASVPVAQTLDFAGDGSVDDMTGFGVFAAAVEVTIRGTSGIAAGPSVVTAGAKGAYNWSFAQVQEGALLNLTIRAWLPWDPNTSVTVVFDVSNATPRTIYSDQNLGLPFTAVESVRLSAPAGTVALARGRSLNVTAAFLNDGNASVGHDTFNVASGSVDVNVTLTDAASGIASELPGTSFTTNITLSASAVAPLQNTSLNLTLASLSGTNFSFSIPLRVDPSRNAIVESVKTVPSPPDEARDATILVMVANAGADLAPAVSVRVRAHNATVADLHSNSTQIDLPPGARVNVSFDWFAPWSPDPVTVLASVSVAFDFDASDDSGTTTFSISSTNAAPVISLAGPQDGARVEGSVQVSGATSDPEGRTVNVAFAVDGSAPFLELSVSSFAFTWDLANLTDGPHRLSALATDDRGNSAADGVSVVVLNRGPNSSPQVAVSSPQEGDIVGPNVTIAGSASDERNELVAVWVSIDEGPESAAQGTFTWSFVWDASAGTEGAHSIRVRAFDGIDPSTPVWANVSVILSAPSSLAFSGLVFAPAIPPPSASALLAGQVQFDTGVLAPGTSVTAQIRGFAPTYAATADPRGRFSLGLQAPPAVGSYTVDLVASSGGLTGNATTSFSVSASTLPDLEVLPDSVSSAPDPPVAGAPVTLTVVITNNATVPANATLRVFDGNRSTGTLLYEWRFFINRSRQASFEHNYSEGVHNLTIVVEDVDPQDANPSNNQLDFTLEVFALPDFEVVSITPSLPRPVAGENITFLVHVRNGGATRGTASIEVWDGEPAPGNGTILLQQDVSLAPGEEERYYAVWTPTPGQHRIVGILVLAQPGETNLLNNRVDLTLVIDSPAAPPPGGFLPAPGAGLAAAAIAGPAAARFVQRRSSRKEDVRRRRGPRTISVIAVVLLAAGAAALLVPAPTSASFSDARQVPGPLNGVCVTCHTDPNGAPPLNAYGSDYFAERNATNGSVDWERFGALDSDADGYNNSVELAGGYLPGDPGSNPRTGMKYEGFTGSGITGLLTAGITLLALALLGIALGFRMLGARNRRLAEKEAEKVKTAQEEPSAGGAPKP